MRSLTRGRRLFWSIGIMAVVVAMGIVWAEDPHTAARKKTGTNRAIAMWHGLPVYAPNADLKFPITHTDAVWHKILTPEQFSITRRGGTEPPYSGVLLYEHRRGTFYSVATGEPLFSSATKYDSGTGWPSFSAPISQRNVILRWDDSFGMHRVEVLDSASGSHLGHLFDDGPAPTGLRYCINSAALVFVPEGATLPPIVRQYLKTHPKAADHE